MNAQPSELEGCQLHPHHSIDFCFDFPVFRIAVGLNIVKRSIDEGRGVRGAQRGPQVYQSS